MRILIADDDRLSRNALAEMVANLGHEVVTASDGREALERLRDPHAGIRMAMLDWTMPHLDGPGVCASVRARSKTDYVYLILVSALSRQAHVVAGLDAGADDFIAKPVNPLEVHARVRAGERMLKSQSALATLQVYLDQVVMNLDSGVLLSQASGRIVFANDALARLAGIPPRHSVGYLREEILALHVEHALEPRPFLAQMLAAGAEPLTLRLELALAEPRVLAWTTKEVALPDGPARLDVCRDVTAEVQLAKILVEKATRDPLTGMLNRGGGDEALAREVSRASRRNTPLSIVMVDIDHFKRVNDTHGHGMGDRVLVEVSKAISQQLRLYDHAIRWGGEEFLIVLPETPGFRAVTVAERLRAAVAAIRNPPCPSVTISAGVAEVRSGEVAAALAEADAALYRAKSAGRDCVRRAGDDGVTVPPDASQPPEHRASLQPP